MKTFYIFLAIIVILTITISIVVGIRLYQGLNPKVVAEGFRTLSFTFYVIGLILSGGLLVGSSVILTMRWSGQWFSKTREQSNEVIKQNNDVINGVIAAITEVMKKQEHTQLPAQNFTLNLKNTERKSLTLTSEEQEEEEKEKLQYKKKDGIY